MEAKIKDFLKIKECQYLGGGSIGEAYFIQSLNQVVKLTTSENEFELASKLKGKHKEFPSLVKIFKTVDISKLKTKFRYAIFQEYLEELLDEYRFNKIYEKMGEQGLNFEYFDYLDLENMDEIDDETAKMIQSISQIVTEVQKLGCRNPDISDSNLGYRKNKLVLFDVMEQGFE